MTFGSSFSNNGKLKSRDFVNEGKQTGMSDFPISRKSDSLQSKLEVCNFYDKSHTDELSQN